MVVSQKTVYGKVQFKMTKRYFLAFSFKEWSDFMEILSPILDADGIYIQATIVVNVVDPSFGIADLVMDKDYHRIRSLVMNKSLILTKKPESLESNDSIVILDYKNNIGEKYTRSGTDWTYSTSSIGSYREEVKTIRESINYYRLIL